MEKISSTIPIQELFPLSKNFQKPTKTSIGKEKAIVKKQIQLPLIVKPENIEINNNIPIKTLKLEPLTEIKSPSQKNELTALKKKEKINQNQNSNKIIRDRFNLYVNNKETISSKEHLLIQKEKDKKTEEIENALKNLVTIKKESLLNRNLHINRANYQKNEHKITIETINNKKTITFKKIPEINHKKTLKFQYYDNFKEENIFNPKKLNTLKRIKSDNFNNDEIQSAFQIRKSNSINNKFKKILKNINNKNEIKNTITHILKNKDSKSFNKSFGLFQNNQKNKKIKILRKERSLSLKHSINYSYDKIKKKFSFDQKLLIPNLNEQSLITKSISSLHSDSYNIGKAMVFSEKIIKINEENHQNTKNNDDYARILPFDNELLCEFNLNLYLSDNYEEKIDPKSQIKGSKIRWREEEYIGSGTYGQVIRAINIETNKIFAVKKINMNIDWGINNHSLKDMEEELKVLQTVSHKNIIEFYGCEQQNDSLYIYLEYMSKGSISSILKTNGPLSINLIKSYSKQILEALIHLHSHKILHKDIKGANILVNSENIVKLADFGCSQQLEKTITMSIKRDSNSLNNLYGSIPWMAPEVIRQTKYGRKADVWSFGCTVLEMATGKQPWSNHNFDNPIAAIMKIGLSEEIPEIPNFLNNELKNFISSCLKRNPEERKSCKELICHKFIRDVLS